MKANVEITGQPNQCSFLFDILVKCENVKSYSKDGSAIVFKSMKAGRAALRVAHDRIKLVTLYEPMLLSNRLLMPNAQAKLKFSILN